MENDYLYTYTQEYGIPLDAEFKTYEEALAHAESDFYEENDVVQNLKNNQPYEEEIYIVKFYYDEFGNIVEIERKLEILEAVGYHGDAIEHCTY